MKQSHATPNHSNVSRRGFLKCAAAAALPCVIPAAALGRDGAVAPSSRITVGLIGTGRRMGGVWSGFRGCADAQGVAVCDVYAPNRERYRKMLGLAEADSYRDFRELIARNDVDTVAIATPDHWHVLQAIAAVRAGKDVYCEKPLSNTIAEGRALVEAVARHGAVFQHGTQLHSLGEVRRACELVRNGYIGKLHTIRIGSPAGHATTGQPTQPVPKELDYDMWLGPAPEAPFTPARVFVHNGLPGWYFVGDYSLSGWIAGFGVHDLDIAHWGMDTQRTGPVSIEGRGAWPKDGLFDTVLTYDIEFRYANDVRIIMTDTSKARHGVRFEGSEGWAFTRGGLTASTPKIRAQQLAPSDVRLDTSPGHVRNFLDCVKTRRETTCPAEVAHRACSAGLLGGIAVKLERKLRWNPAAERFINDDQANRMLDYAHRTPWRL